MSSAPRVAGRIEKGASTPDVENLLVEVWLPGRMAQAVPDVVPLSPSVRAALPTTLQDRLATAFLGRARTTAGGQFRIELPQGVDFGDHGNAEVRVRVFDDQHETALGTTIQSVTPGADGDFDAGTVILRQGRRRIPALAVAVAVVLAGCSALFGEGAEDGETTPVPEPSPPSPTPTPSPLPDDPSDDISETPEPEPTPESPTEEPPTEEPPTEEPPEKKSEERLRQWWRNRTEAQTPEPDAEPDPVPPVEDPAPAPTAPALNPTVPSDFATRIEHIYTGDDPPQELADPSIIERHRVAALGGQVRTPMGEPLGGVTVTIHGHPEYGHTTTRSDGTYALVVNGGGHPVLQFELEGYLPVQRQVSARWRTYERLPAVVMTPLDTTVSTVEVGSNEMQAVRSSVSSDASGDRQATILVPPGTAATVKTPEGLVLPERLLVRATEYTVGASGPAAMPGHLPRTSAYTYAVEFTANPDGEMTPLPAGQRPFLEVEGADVQFDQDVFHYLENFLGFAVGTAVPVGFYDDGIAAWTPSGDGQILEILSVTGGLAELDLDGSGTAADAETLAAFGITDDERAKLAGLYAPGQELWRTPIPHFTPWDCNWPYGLPPDARPPNLPEPDDPDADPDPNPGDPDELDTDDPCEEGA